jgi:hypothetical protein
VDRPDIRNMAIPTMATSIISVKQASASVWRPPKAVAWRTSSARSVNPCCASASRGVGSAVPGASASPSSCTL